MAHQPKQKTRKHEKPAKPATKMPNWKSDPTDDGMVVFPMANGKLATTWVQNVDAILSEGTGKLSIDRMKQLKDKLTNTLALLDHRLYELQMKKADEDAAKERLEALQYIIDNYIGKQVQTIPPSGPTENLCNGVLVTGASITGDTFNMEGLCAFCYRKYRPDATMSHHGIIQNDLHEKINTIHVVYPDPKDRKLFKLTFDNSHLGTFVFGSPTVADDDNQKELIDTFFKQIGARKHACDKPVRKKLKLSIKRGPKHDSK